MNRQLTIYDQLAGDDERNKVSPAKTLGDTKIQAIHRYLDRTKKYKIDPKPHVQKYCPNGRKTKYYRLSYRNPWTGKQKTVHINGGNINSRLVNYRKNQLQQLIDRGAELAEVLAMVETFNGGGNSSNE